MAITSTTAGTHGGGIYFGTSGGSTLNIYTATTISQVYANGQGGLAYFGGTTNTATMTGSSSITTVAASTGGTLTGGIFYMFGTTDNTVTVTSSTISTVTTTSQGGCFYFYGTTQSLTLTGATISTVTAGADGGLLYSNPNTQILTASITLGSTITGVKSSTLGSLISLRKGPTTPTLELTVTSSTMSCQTTDLQPNLVATLGNLDSLTPTATIGGAFYFEGTTSTSWVLSTSNTYKNCFTAGSGALFYLPTDLTFEDTGSTFKQTAALQGAIYCSGCSATFENSVFKDTYAGYGSIIYMMNDALVEIINPTMSFGKARVYGGAIYAGGSSNTRSTPTIPTLTISGCTTGPTYFDSKQDGGFLYSDNPDLDVVISSCSFSNLYAHDYGGFAKGVQMDSFSLSSCGST